MSKYIRWGTAQVNKVNLDKWLRKKLMKLVVQSNYTIDITYGARQILQERKREYSSATWKLIVTSGDKELLQIFINDLPEKLLEQVAYSDQHEVLNYLPFKQIEPLIPILLKHKKGLGGSLKRIIIKEAAPNFEEYIKYNFLHEVIMNHEKCPVELFYKLLQRNLKLALNYNIGDKLDSFIAKGSIKVSLNKTEYKL